MVRVAEHNELAEIMNIFEKARSFMRSSGNPFQWVNGYPSEEIVTRDIRQRNFYVEEIDGVITGCFAFIVGPEPTYKEIKGRWLSDLPYGTIHRLASSGEVKGLAFRCFDFCRSIIPNLRADTHEKNTVMQKRLLEYGFNYCGIIHVADGSERLAYQYPPC